MTTPTTRNILGFKIESTAEQDIYGYDMMDCKFCNFKTPTESYHVLVHRESMSTLKNDGAWRDSNGRFVSEPEERSYSREYQYIFSENHGYRKYAIQDAKRLEDYENGGWCILTLGVTVTHIATGIKLGSAYLGGVESDLSDSDTHAERCWNGLLSEAIQSAKSNRQSIAA